MLPRKIWHASGILIVILYDGLDLTRMLAAGLLFGVTALLLLLDLARHRFPAVQELFRRSARAILDPKDERGLNGATFYWGGCALAVAAFPKEVACAGILALVLGDPAAALVGSSVQSPRWGRVSLAGSGACFAVAALAVRYYFPWPQAIAAGVAAALLEAFSGSKLDNAAIPLGTATVLWVTLNL
jgi:dolichol kinase